MLNIYKAQQLLLTKFVGYLITVSLFMLISAQYGYSQDPQLPPTNLGLSNMQDGNPPPGSGFVLQQFMQVYQTHRFKDAESKTIDAPKISSLLSMTQLIYSSKQKVEG